MNKKYLSPRTYSIIAVIIGIALCEDKNINEQNAIGNWLMLIGQYMETNAAIEQDIKSKTNNTINSNIIDDNFKYGRSSTNKDILDSDTIKELIKTVDKIKSELEKLNQ